MRLFCCADGGFIADRQLVATLGPAASQYSPAIGGLHPDPEAVGLGALAVIRLERTFWHYRLSLYWRFRGCAQTQCGPSTEYELSVYTLAGWELRPMGKHAGPGPES